MAEPVGTCHRICQIFDFEEIVVFLETLFSSLFLFTSLDNIFLPNHRINFEALDPID